MILNLPITKIFNKIYACNLVCKLELAFHYLSCRKYREYLHVPAIFQPKNTFCLFFVYIFKILRSCLHYDVIMTSYDADGWYLFWYQWKKETHSFTVVANIRVQDVYYRKSKGGCNNPPSEDVLQKLAQDFDRERGFKKEINKQIQQQTQRPR